MFPKTCAIGEYVYDDYPEHGNESEYVYEEEHKAPDSRNATNNDGEYVYDEGEYVLEKKSRTTYPNPTKGSTPETKKPGHRKGDPDIYDELDYELSPRVEVGIERREVNQDKTILKDSTKTDIGSKKKKIIIGSVVGVCLVAAIFGTFYFGVVVGSRGRYDFMIFLLLAENLLYHLNQ